MNFWDLYGPSSFLSEIEEGLRAHRAGVVMFPSHHPKGFGETICARLASQAWYRVPLAWNEGENPLDFLFRELGIKLELKERQSAANFVKGLKSTVVLVEDIGASDWPHWKLFLQEYERELRAGTNEQPPLLLCVLKGVDREAARLHAPAIAEYPWSGVVSELDTQVFIRAQLANIDKPGAVRDFSRRIVARLSLWDVELAAKLVPLSIKDLCQPNGLLADIASERKWSKGGKSCWCLGTEDIFEGQLMSHSLWLSINEGSSEVDLRIWHAQASIGLPLVEQRRRQLAARAARYLRFPITVEGEQVYKVEDLEIGQLSYQLFQARCSDRDLTRRVNHLKRVRNKLAHVEVVDPAWLLDTDLIGSGS